MIGWCYPVAGMEEHLDGRPSGCFERLMSGSHPSLCNSRCFSRAIHPTLVFWSLLEDGKATVLYRDETCVSDSPQDLMPSRVT